MATYKKRGESWQVRIRHKSFKGGSRSKTFKKKSLAESWAKEIEQELSGGSFVDTRSADKILMADLFERYKNEISVKNSIETQEVQGYIIERLKIKTKKLSVNECDESYWFEHGKERRLVDGVAPATLIKDLQLVKATFDAAMTIWKIKLKANPVQAARKMLNMMDLLVGADRQRVRRIHAGELSKIEKYKPTKFSLVKHATLFAKETGMRRGEIASMEWPRVQWNEYVYDLEKEKNDKAKKIVGQGRLVPLSPRAIQILEEVLTFKMSGQAEYGDYIWPWRDPHSLTTAYRRMCERIGVDPKELHFHDSRHEHGSANVDNEVDPRISAAGMGHMDLRSQSRYQHPDLKKYARKMHEKGE